MLESFEILNAAAVVRVRFLDYQFDLLMAELDLPHRPSDAQVKAAVAAVLELPAEKLDVFAVDRHVDGNITLRPRGDEESM